jgi:hypothetical protein
MMIRRAVAAASRLQIQYASDLHLEFGATCGSFPSLLKPTAPLLALAGDIGNPTQPIYREFLSYCSRHWDDTFIVTGNHEAYCLPGQPIQTVSERLALCKSVARDVGPNIHVLHRRRVDRCGVAFLGATLWTSFAEGGAAEAQRSMNDYRLIWVDGVRRMTPADSMAWHAADRAWLDAEITACEEEGRPAVVITHHLPSYQLIASEYEGSPLNSAFASDCEDLIRPPVRGWIAGHTHTGIHRTWTHADGSHTVAGVNPHGYPMEAKRNMSGYCSSLVLDISVDPGTGGDSRDPLLVASTERADGHTDLSTFHGDSRSPSQSSASSESFEFQ